VAITFDGATKIATLSAGTTSLSVRDLWSRWVDWLLTSDNSKYQIAMSQVGGDDIDPGAGTQIPVYVFLVNGWKIKPQEANHTLNVVDGILLVSGGGDPFNNTAGSFVVRVNYQQPVQAISFATGGSGLSSGQDAALALVVKLLRNKRVTDPTTGIQTLYDDDGNPLLTGPLFEDVAGTQPYRGQGAERAERLT